MVNIHEIEAFVITIEPGGERMKRFAHSAAEQHLHTTVYHGWRGNKWKIKPDSYTHINYAMTANCLTNIMILEQQKARPGWTLILEDDVLLSPDFAQRLPAALEHMPADRDCYFLGWMPYTYAPEEFHYVKTPVNHLWSDVSVFHGNYGYLIHNSRIDRVLDALPELWHNIDWMLYGAQREGKLHHAFLTDPIVLHDWAFGSMVGAGDK